MRRYRNFKAGSHPAGWLSAMMGCGLIWLSGCGGGGTASPDAATNGGESAALPTTSIQPNGTAKEPVDVTPALNSPEAKTRFAGLMAEPVPNSPEEFGNFMKSELAKYEKVVKASGAKAD